VVLDTNVIVAALQSSRGASNAILRQVGTGAFSTALSVPLMFEYEDVLSRPQFNFEPVQVNAVLDYLAASSSHHQIPFLWRPHLPDPKDDMVLELAFNANCEFIVTFNQKDFRRSPELGIKTIQPREFLALIGGTS
jgi:putative PIN family toxin of toxin-antitoxin system